MIRRIVLDNFMSHRHTVIEPAEGLTVLAGPNNCGKSAVVVALQTLCGRHAGDFMVRHGQKDCRVCVETDDGHAIEWRRKGATVSYNIDGKDIHRLQRQVPEELDMLLGLPEVSDPEGKETFDIHFADQKHPLFLLDRSGRQAAVFFASSSDAALLMAMQKRHKDKARDAKTDEKRLARDVDDLAQQVTTLEPVEAIDRRLAEIEKTFDCLQRESGLLAALTGCIDDLDRQARATHQTSLLAATLVTLPSPPILRDALPLEALCSAMQQQEGAVGSNGDRAKALDDLKHPPVLPPVEPLAQLCEDIRRHGGHVVHLRAEANCLDPLSLPPPQDDAATLSSLIEAWQAAARTLGRVARGAASLAELPTAPSLADTASLAEGIEQLGAGEAAVARCRDDLAHSVAEQSAAEHAIRRWVLANPLCALCGQAIDPDTMLSTGGHSHAQA